MMKKYQIALILLLASVKVMSQDMQRSPSGASYKVVKAGSGPKIKVDDIITFNFIQKTGKDSVLMSSYQAGNPVKIRVQPSKSIGDLMDVFTLLSVKDSVVVQVPTDSIFKGHDEERPPFLPKGSNLVFNIKIERVQTLDEAIAENNRAIDSLKNQEKVTLDKYLAANKPVAKTTASGLMYGITTPSVKPKPVAGDTVYVNYIGRTLEGKVFDTSIEAEAQKAGIFNPGRPYEPLSFVLGAGEMIPAWDEGFLLFNAGSKGFLITPSSLAYGERGGGELIKPFSTLLFDVELVKVKRPAPPAVKKPVVTKKPVTTTKKPATTTKPATAPAKKPAAPAAKKPAAVKKAG